MGDDLAELLRRRALIEDAACSGEIDDVIDPAQTSGRARRAGETTC